jgi:hypothetical protein
VSLIHRSGRRVVLVIAPDKSTIYPEYLPDVNAEKACGLKGKATYWPMIEGSRVPGILPMRRNMLAIKKPPPDNSYFRLDDHWDTVAGVNATREALQSLHTNVQIQDSDLHRTRVRYTGGLTNLLGKPEQDTAPALIVQRHGIPATTSSPMKLPAKGVGELRSRPPDPKRLIPGNTLFISDSFGLGMIDALQSYTTDMSWVQWFENNERSLAAAIEGADTVVLETVERELNFRASDQGYVTERLLARLKRELGPPPRARRG